MRTDLTDITLVIDRSGSMSAVRTDAEGGINSFIASQAAHAGEALLTLIHFDTEFEFVHRGVQIRQVPAYTLVPRGYTALLDAVGRGINATGERLALMSEDDRPGLVAFVIVTDGKENSSREFTKQQIKEMIERQQNEYSWKFTYLGANQDAFAEAGAMGIDSAAVADYATGKEKEVYTCASNMVFRARSALAAGQHVSKDLYSFTAEERKAMKDKGRAQ